MRTKPVKNHTWTHRHPLPADPLLFLQLRWPAWFFSINAANPFFLLGNERVKMVFNSSTPWASKAITTETGKWKNRAPAPKLCLQTVPMLRKRVHCAVQNSILHLAIQEKKKSGALERKFVKKNKKNKTYNWWELFFLYKISISQEKRKSLLQQLHPGRVMDILEKASVEAKGSSYFVTVVRSSRSRKQPLHRPLHLRPCHNTAATWVNTCLFQRHTP